MHHIKTRIQHAGQVLLHDPWRYKSRNGYHVHWNAHHNCHALLQQVCRRWTSSLSDIRRITFLTDVEGDAAYLDRFVKNSKILHFQKNDGHECPYNHTTTATTISSSSSCSKRIEFSSPHDMLIFGGDMWDKGGCDLSVIRQLLDFKHRYPDRVHFVLGNRDINKMRLRQELLAPCHEGVWWRPTDAPDPAWSTSQRLVWILANTMGSPKAFEFRRLELEQERKGLNSSVITDDDVVQSYLDSCHAKTGEMGILLQQATLCFKLGKLFVVHGALPWMISKPICNTQEYPLAMPWLTTPLQLSSPLDWMEALNNFGHEQIEQWQQSSDCIPTRGVWATKGGFDYWPSDDGKSYAGLLQYGMGWLPSTERLATVVYSSWTQKGMPCQFYHPNSLEAELTKSFMNDADIQLILSGHQPQGDLPTPIRLENDKLIMACDTSYSGDVQWLGRETLQTVGGRGLEAVCETLIEQCVESGNIQSVVNHGVLSDGTPFETHNLFEQREDTTAGRLSTFGLDSNQRWWVKADFGNGSQLISKAEGFDVVNAITNSNKSCQGSNCDLSIGANYPSFGG